MDIYFGTICFIGDSWNWSWPRLHRYFRVRSEDSFGHRRLFRRGQNCIVCTNKQPKIRLKHIVEIILIFDVFCHTCQTTLFYRKGYTDSAWIHSNLDRMDFKKWRRYYDKGLCHGWEHISICQEAVENRLYQLESLGKTSWKVMDWFIITTFIIYKRIGIGQCPIFLEHLIFPRKSMQHLL